MLPLCSIIRLRHKSVSDLLTKPEIKLTKAEEQQVKKVAEDLLETLKRGRVVLDWKKQQTTRAAVLVTIEAVLDQLPRVYTPELYEQKCQSVYQHVFDSYQEQNKSLYVNRRIIEAQRRIWQMTTSIGPIATVTSCIIFLLARRS
jgi:Domain of unknown function (DUF3387)